MITTPLLSHWPQEAWGNQDFGILARTCVGYEDVAFWADAVASYASCINSGKVILSRASPHHSHTHPHHGIQSTSFFFFFHFHLLTFLLSWVFAAAWTFLWLQQAGATLQLRCTDFSLQ